MSRLVLALAFTLIAVSAAAQTEPSKTQVPQPPVPVVPRSGGPEVSQLAVQRVLVGERAPEFDLLSAAGERTRLRETRGNWVALFFTDRREDMPRLAGLAHTLDSLNVHTVVVCSEKVQSLRAWRDSTNAPMLVLADERGDISALYGLWDNTHGATRQGLFLLDPEGIVRVALLGQKVSAPSLPGLVHSATEDL
jgi:peroxiredoxin